MKRWSFCCVQYVRRLRRLSAIRRPESNGTCPHAELRIHIIAVQRQRLYAGDAGEFHDDIDIIVIVVDRDVASSISASSPPQVEHDAVVGSVGELAVGQDGYGAFDIRRIGRRYAGRETNRFDRGVERVAGS